jgi:hypothetical protein
MVTLFFWIGTSIAVGMAAHNYRNRDGVGWFFLSLIISPVLGGLFLLACKSKVKIEFTYGNYGNRNVAGSGVVATGSVVQGVIGIVLLVTAITLGAVFVIFVGNVSHHATVDHAPPSAFLLIGLIEESLLSSSESSGGGIQSGAPQAMPRPSPISPNGCDHEQETRSKARSQDARQSSLGTKTL